MPSELRPLLLLFLKYCFHIFLMYRPIRKRPKRRRPPHHAAAEPRPLPLVAGDGLAVGGVPSEMRRSV